MYILYHEDEDYVEGLILEVEWLNINHILLEKLLLDMA